jgi:hypothetical protein
MAKRIDSRLRDLEKDTQPGGGFMVVWQDLDDKNLYHTKPRYGPERDQGETYTREQVDRLEAETLLIVDYVKDWRGTNERQ